MLAACFVIGAVVATPVSAATLNVTYQQSNVFGSPDLSRVVDIQSAGYTGKAKAGPFRLTGSNGYGNFIAFCVDLSKQLKNGKNYTTSANSAFGAKVDRRIDKLFTSAYAGISTAVHGAAFQLALWEIISDTGRRNNLSRGRFKVKAGKAVISQANAYLKGLRSASTGGYAITYMTSGKSQNIVTVSPVPIPAAFGMLGLGVAALFGLRRRKSV